MRLTSEEWDLLARHCERYADWYTALADVDLTSEEYADAEMLQMRRTSRAAYYRRRAEQFRRLAPRMGLIVREMD